MYTKMSLIITYLFFFFSMGSFISCLGDYSQEWLIRRLTTEQNKTCAAIAQAKKNKSSIQDLLNESYALFSMYRCIYKLPSVTEENAYHCLEQSLNFLKEDNPVRTKIKTEFAQWIEESKTD
jgi:hypothetical protein